MEDKEESGEVSARFISFADKIRCLERELAFRKYLYPKQVASGRMKQEKMDSEIATMEAILVDIKVLAGRRE